MTMSDSASSATDQELLDALRRGDEDAYMTLVDLYQPSMKRIALLFVSDRALADEVIQDAWIGVLRGLATFQGRSSLKTWIFSILTNRAKTVARREGRYVPLAPNDSDSEPAVSADRFDPPGAEWAG